MHVLWTQPPAPALTIPSSRPGPGLAYENLCIPTTGTEGTQVCVALCRHRDSAVKLPAWVLPESPRSLEELVAPPSQARSAHGPGPDQLYEQEMGSNVRGSHPGLAGRSTGALSWPESSPSKPVLRLP